MAEYPKSKGKTKITPKPWHVLIPVPKLFPNSNGFGDGLNNTHG